MGDCGSLFVGFLLAALAILGTWRDAATLAVSLGIPILVLGVPIFDTTLVTIMRLLHKRPVSQGGKDHSSHRLLNIGLSPKQVALTIYFAALILGSAAIFMLESTPKRMIFIFISIIVMAFVIGLRLGRVDVGYSCESAKKVLKKTSKTSKSKILKSKSTKSKSTKSKSVKSKKNNES
jgi:UDP-GlcNAc:undecaprenyl-phosphate GlcNAc-1-phosphate transferase